MATREILLAARDIEASYGAKQILFGASFDVYKGEVVALLGANGSGKSTLLNTVSGFVKSFAGTIRLKDKIELTGLPPFRTFRHGVVQVSQSRDLFADMSVEDNLLMGAVVNGARETASLTLVYELFPKLAERRSQLVHLMSGGEQQMVAIGRALMSSPSLLLLDEPSGGLSPKVVDEIGNALIAMKNRGITMLIVEQNIKLALAIADRFLILRSGMVSERGDIVRGSAIEEDIVRKIYL